MPERRSGAQFRAAIYAIIGFFATAVFGAGVFIAVPGIAQASPLWDYFGVVLYAWNACWLLGAAIVIAGFSSHSDRLLAVGCTLFGCGSVAYSAAVSAGPGSWTGIWIGAALAIGCFTLAAALVVLTRQPATGRRHDD